MPTKPVKFFTSWSFSRWKDWMECPLKAKYKHLDKVAEGPKGAALIRGGEIDKEAELFLSAKKTPKKVPDSLKLFRNEFFKLRESKALPQAKWGLTKDWAPIDFFDWGKTWCRVVLDAHYYVPKKKHAVVIDFKTGRIYPDNLLQVQLYVLAGFAHYDQAETIEARLWYLDQGEILPKGKDGVFTRKDAGPLQSRWEASVAPMFADRKFLARPGDYCGRCAFSQRKGGPCKY